jgi:hypothetical protein
VSVVLAFALGPLAWAVEPFPWPAIPLESTRGLSPQEAAVVERRNQAHLQGWREALTPEQAAAWRQAMGLPAEAIRRLGVLALPDAAAGYDWRAAAESAGLGAEDRERLDELKVMIEDVSLKQVFEAYTAPRGSMFITSDSLLNAFHRLFEDGFRELELRRAQQLRPELEAVLHRARELIAGRRNGFPPETLQPGLRHAQLILGPALHLMGSPLETFDPDVREEIERQVNRIRQAQTAELPDWLAPATRNLVAIDYRRMVPVGFYAGRPSLQNYYRAVRWLQSVPFRAERDHELTAIGLLGYACFESRRDYWLASYDEFLGRPDAPSLADSAQEFQNFLLGSRDLSWPGRLAQVRQWLEHSSERGRLNDALRFRPADGEAGGAIEIRVLSPHRLPESLALARLAEPGQLPPALVVAALVGSEFATEQLAAVPPERLKTAIEAAREAWRPATDAYPTKTSVHDEYLHVLAALALPPEPEAPTLFGSRAWAAKSCQAIMAGWAQMRHTFTLQAKENVNYFGLHDVPPGFVEPNPEFFHRLANLVERLGRRLDELGAFTSSPAAEVEELRVAAELLERLELHRPGASPADLERLSAEERNAYDAAWQAPGEAWHWDAEMPQAFERKHEMLLHWFQQEIARRESGAGLAAASESSSRLREQWRTLTTCARRLEAMAHKQLRGQDWSEQEKKFLHGYGEQLGFMMGYEGNSWLSPRDYAPRWATVTDDPATGRLLAVGVGRPRLIRVLYPWKGTEILTTGAVLSYYEYADTTRRTDDDWKALLDSEQDPRPPAWLEPYLLR